ncbi:MAG: Cell shape-determining protein MreC precursor [candidate division WS6 bacterium OLB20]|uniref:Cell shape-determining protein MreC n=1 Tax=candidate division WS6 bacterium OLB20 TaxID=1617426 RepID=A0A136LYB8_9BACT|nr:MAG: Cell shape-determining protein MreC precursor [candidate division WS6 bacterium OLB20]
MRGQSFLLTPVQIASGVVISFLLILFSFAGTFDGFRVLIGAVLAGVQSDSTAFFGGFADELDFLSSLSSLRDERDQLIEENLALESENATLKTQLDDLRSVTKELQFDLPFELIPVRVRFYDQARMGEVIINKGSDSNIAVSDVVIVDNFAVGEVISVEPRSARVRLLTSPESAVPVKVIGTETKGLLRGEFGTGLILTEVLNERTLEKGEQLITTGINTSFPFGLNAGTAGDVISLESELTKRARVISPVEFNNLQRLFVLKQ